MTGLWRGSRAVRRTVRILFPIFCGYAVLTLMGVLFVNRFIFQPHPPTYADTADMLKLPTVDGAQITALHLPNPAARFTILFSHGNAEDLGDILPFLKEMQAAGFAVFAYDYHGYGTSGGRPSERNAYHDIDASYAHLTRTVGLPPRRIIVHGRSLGAAVAVDLAAREPVGGLVIESGFVSAFRVVTHWPLLPGDKFRNLDKIARVRCPVLVIHGRNDRLIRFWHGERLFARAQTPKRCLWVDGAGHNDVRLVAGEVYWQALREFAELVHKTQDKS